MACNLTSNITKENCQYSVAGVKALYLINYDPQTKYDSAQSGSSADKQQLINKITLPTGSKAYKMDFIDNTASWTDDLAVNGNGGKYRTHTVNFTLSDYNYTILNQEMAISLGKFTAIVVDKAGRVVVLGRNNGLSATSFNYASGAADADANGWTTVLAGTETEIGQLLTDENVIAQLVENPTPKPAKVTP